MCKPFTSRGSRGRRECSPRGREAVARSHFRSWFGIITSNGDAPSLHALRAETRLTVYRAHASDFSGNEIIYADDTLQVTRRALPVVIVLIIYNIGAWEIFALQNHPPPHPLFLISQETHENPMVFNDSLS